MKIRVEISGLANSKLSGVGYYTKLLTEALDKYPDTKVLTSYFSFLNRQTEPIISLKNTPHKNIYFPLRVYSKLQSYGLAVPFDLFLPKVDLTIFPNFSTWPTAKSKLRATVIHDLTYLYFPELVESKNLVHLKRIVPQSIKKADFIITVSEAVKSELIKEFSIDPNMCLVTPIPPDESFFRPNNNEIHQKYSIPTKKYIYFIGNLEPRKDLPTLIEAYRKLPTNIKKEFSLIIAGGNGWKTEKSQKALSSAKKAGENVIHIGYVDQKDSPALFQNASLLVMPSLYEGFGMPIVEAMASKTPVLASDIPVLRETGGDAILYAKPGDVLDFCNKIKDILTNPKLANELNKKAETRLKEISWENNAKKITDLTRKILAK